MKKRLLPILLSLLLLCLLIPQVTMLASAQTYSGNCGVNGDNVTWSLDTATGLLTLKGSGEVRNAPWYRYADVITAVSIEEGITNICSYAFYNCTSLSSIVIPDSVSYIGERAFEGCTGLSAVTLGKGVSYLGDSAFQGCAALQRIELPDSVRYLGVYAFKDCAILDTVRLGTGVESIDEYAFENCVSLRRVEIKELGAWCGIVFANELSNPLRYAHLLYQEEISNDKSEYKLVTTVEIPEGVEQVNSYSFYGLSSLVSLTLSDSVNAIGRQAFYQCTGLRNVSFDAALTAIGERAFAGCTSLAILSLPEQLNTLAERAFENCSSLLSVELPDGLRRIEPRTFSGCTALKSVTMPAGLQSVGQYAFDDCYSLNRVDIRDLGAWCGVEFEALDENDPRTVFCTNPLCYAKSLYLNGTLVKELVIPETVNEIKAHVFELATSIEKLTLPESVVSIGDRAFFGCTKLEDAVLGDGLQEIGEEAFAGAGLKTVEFGIGLRSISKAAFRDCRELTKVLLNNRVESIGENAFAACTNLTEARLGASIKRIEIGAFNGCTKLVRVLIPASVKTIEAAFVGCDSLQHVFFTGSKAAWDVIEINSSNFRLTSAEYIHYNVVSPEEHIFVENTVAATCTDGSYIRYSCKCGHYTWTEQTGPALGHNYVNGVCTNCKQKDPKYSFPFVDVSNNAYYKPAVEWALSQKITEGVDAKHFGPTQGCTRGQVVTFLWRACGSPKSNMSASPFTDVKSGKYYYNAVLWAVENNITSGKTTTLFAPGEYCSRAQVVTFLWRVNQTPKTEGENPFVDVKPTQYYYEAVLWAIDQGITNGIDTTHFGPNVICNRAQVVTFLYRAFAKK